jgi:CRP-like cAMP-binding protein
MVVMSEHKNPAPLLHIEEVLPVLNRIAILGGLTDAQLYRVFRLLQTISYQKGDVIFEQGSAPSHIYIVLLGSVKLVAYLDLEPMELLFLDAGACFGETAVISIQKHEASAIATESTELLIFPRHELFGLYETDPGLFGMLMLNIAREACRRLRKTGDVMLNYAMRKK